MAKQNLERQEKGDCPRCQGSGWVCEVHRMKPMNHMLPNRKECGGAGAPCEEPGCPFRTHPTDAAAQDAKGEQ